MSTGALTVTILPAAAVTLGAQWQVDGGAALNSGATASGLTVGNHAVTFTRIPGYTPAIPETVAIASGVTSTLTGVYIPTPVMQFKMTPYNPLLVGCANGCKISSAWYLAYNPVPKGSGPINPATGLATTQTFVQPGIYYYPSQTLGGNQPLAGNYPEFGNVSLAQAGFGIIAIDSQNGIIVPAQPPYGLNTLNYSTPWLCISNDNSEPNCVISYGEGVWGIEGICPSVSTFTTMQSLLPGKWSILCVPAYDNRTAGNNSFFGAAGQLFRSTFIVNKPSPFGANFPPASGMAGALQIVDGGGNFLSAPDFTLTALIVPGTNLPQIHFEPGFQTYGYNWTQFDGCNVGFGWDGTASDPNDLNQFYIATITIREGQFLKFNASAAVPNYLVMGVYQECTPCPGILPSTRL